MNKAAYPAKKISAARAIVDARRVFIDSIYSSTR
jgi:hypothetical protein